jgi:selenide,water dikinase
VPHRWVDPIAGPLDDAAVVRPEGASRSLVMTIDVVTPMVDDPVAFGAIAATNALSDVYAMGGVPEVALSFVGFPTDKLPLEVLRAVLLGMTEACAAAKCAIVGGHTIVDPEPKAGLSVTGSVASDRVWSHRTARAGQALVLTKAIGTGIVVQAMKKGDLSADEAAATIAQMRTLNARARDLGAEAGATAGTDVTGFGLLGHLVNMVEASSVRARLSASLVPILPHARELASRGVAPGGSKRNLHYVAPKVDFDARVDDVTRLLLADAQTSGGLLLAVPEDAAERLAKSLRDEGHAAAVVGALEPAETGGPSIRVEP